MYFIVNFLHKYCSGKCLEDCIGMLCKHALDFRL